MNRFALFAQQKGQSDGPSVRRSLDRFRTLVRDGERARSGHHRLLNRRSSLPRVSRPLVPFPGLPAKPSTSFGRSRSHLPMLHIGMEHLQMQNIDIASGNFESALATCQTDPLLFNEMGVVAYSRGESVPHLIVFTDQVGADEIVPFSRSAVTSWLSTISRRL